MSSDPLSIPVQSGELGEVIHLKVFVRSGDPAKV